jgi:hypothetical protein
MSTQRGGFHFTLCLLVGIFGFAAGCGGTTPSTGGTGGTGGGSDVDMAGTGSGGTGGGDMAGEGTMSLALFAPCTDNSQCQSGLCTKISYDRAPGPICTYMCDAMDQNPKCPMGCNPKGYCKKPM